MTTCATCGQPTPVSVRPCAGCGHSMSYHALAEKPPRLHKACTVHEAGTKCGCRQYTAVKS